VLPIRVVWATAPEPLAAVAVVAADIVKSARCTQRSAQAVGKRLRFLSSHAKIDLSIAAIASSLAHLVVAVTTVDHAGNAHE
jgi:hypothetical protein